MQKERAQQILDSELRVLDEQRRQAQAAGDTARFKALTVRLGRLRARKDAVDQELHAPP